MRWRAAGHGTAASPKTDSPLELPPAEHVTVLYPLLLLILYLAIYLAKMQLWHSLQLCLLAAAIPARAASAWGYTDATVSVQTKGAGVGSGFKQEYDAFHNPLFL